MVIAFTDGEPYIGLRWIFANGQADTARVHNHLRQALEAFPELRTTSLGYTDFLDFLGID